MYEHFDNIKLMDEMKTQAESERLTSQRPEHDSDCCSARLPAMCVYMCVCACDICHRGVRNVTAAIGHRRDACWVHADWLNFVWPRKNKQIRYSSVCSTETNVLIYIDT